MAAQSVLVACSLAERNNRLFESGDYHDFVVRCGAKEFKVHRNIICPQSSVLRTLCDPLWKEGTEGCATLSDQDPDIVALALRFLYTGHYDTDCTCKDEVPALPSNLETTESCLNCVKCQKGDLMTDVRIYILGDYLDITELKNLSLSRCQHILELHFQPQAFVEAIGEALSNTKHDDPGLRKQILRSCCDKYKSIGEDSDLWRLLMEHEPTAWMLGVETQVMKGDLYNQISEIFCQKVEMSRELEHRKKDIQRATDNLAAAVKLVNGKSSCRNDSCNKEFGASLETYANGYIKGLRCNRCRCKLLIRPSWLDHRHGVPLDI